MLAFDAVVSGKRGGGSDGRTLGCTLVAGFSFVLGVTTFIIVILLNARLNAYIASDSAPSAYTGDAGVYCNTTGYPGFTWHAPDAVADPVCLPFANVPVGGDGGDVGGTLGNLTLNAAGVGAGTYCNGTGEYVRNLVMDAAARVLSVACGVDSDAPINETGLAAGPYCDGPDEYQRNTTYNAEGRAVSVECGSLAVGDPATATYGGDDKLVTFVRDGQGRVVSAANGSVALTVNTVFSGGDITGTGTVLNYTSRGITPGTYGNASCIPAITLDAAGVVTVTPDCITFSTGGSGNGGLIIGTVNQVIVTPSGNDSILSTPQDIATTSNVQFNNVRATGTLKAGATTPSFSGQAHSFSNDAVDAPDKGPGVSFVHSTVSSVPVFEFAYEPFYDYAYMMWGASYDHYANDAAPRITTANVDAYEVNHFEGSLAFLRWTGGPGLYATGSQSDMRLTELGVVIENRLRPLFGVDIPSTGILTDKPALHASRYGIAWNMYYDNAIAARHSGTGVAPLELYRSGNTLNVRRCDTGTVGDLVTGCLDRLRLDAGTVGRTTFSIFDGNTANVGTQHVVHVDHYAIAFGGAYAGDSGVNEVDSLYEQRSYNTHVAVIQNTPQGLDFRFAPTNVGLGNTVTPAKMLRINSQRAFFASPPSVDTYAGGFMLVSDPGTQRVVESAVTVASLASVIEADSAITFTSCGHPSTGDITYNVERIGTRRVTVMLTGSQTITIPFASVCAGFAANTALPISYRPSSLRTGVVTLGYGGFTSVAIISVSAGGIITLVNTISGAAPVPDHDAAFGDGTWTLGSRNPTFTYLI